MATPEQGRTPETPNPEHHRKIRTLRQLGIALKCWHQMQLDNPHRYDGATGRVFIERFEEDNSESPKDDGRYSAVGRLSLTPPDTDSLPTKTQTSYYAAISSEGKPELVIVTEALHKDKRSQRDPDTHEQIIEFDSVSQTVSICRSADHKPEGSPQSQEYSFSKVPNDIYGSLQANWVNLLSEILNPIKDSVLEAPPGLAALPNRQRLKPEQRKAVLDFLCQETQAFLKSKQPPKTRTPSVHTYGEKTRAINNSVEIDHTRDGQMININSWEFWQPTKDLDETTQDACEALKKVTLIDRVNGVPDTIMQQTQKLQAHLRVRFPKPEALEGLTGHWHQLTLQQNPNALYGIEATFTSVERTLAGEQMIIDQTSSQPLDHPESIDPAVLYTWWTLLS